jgi:hypothetical protein
MICKLQLNRKVIFFKKKLEVASPSVWAVALGEEVFFFFLKKGLPRVPPPGHSGKIFFFFLKKGASPSAASKALGEDFFLF